MTGPFKQEDFGTPWGDCLSTQQASMISNEIDAKRWACEKGGEHFSRDPMLYVHVDFPLGSLVATCFKCGKQLKAKWEAV